MQVGVTSVIKLEYVLKLEGKVLERTTAGKTKTILLGHEKGLPPGLAQVVVGRRAGETYTAQCGNGYGEIDPSKVHIVPRSEFPQSAKLEVGELFYSKDAEGKPLSLRVTAVNSDTVTLDSNHEHAGKTLEYSITLHSVREAQQEELEHGHVHGEGGVVHNH